MKISKHLLGLSLLLGVFFIQTSFEQKYTFCGGDFTRLCTSDGKEFTSFDKVFEDHSNMYVVLFKKI